MGSDDNGLFSNSRLTALLVGIGSAGIVVSIYHCISVALYRQQHRARQHQDLASRRLSEGPGPVITEVPVNPSIENSTVHLIPAHKYRRGDIPVVEETVCSICLCEFEDGEEIRSLPECIHSFHAPCIDTWLYSHSSCPMCRADATHSPVILPVPNGPGPEAVEGTRDEQVTSVHVPEAVP